MATDAFSAFVSETVKSALDDIVALHEYSSADKRALGDTCNSIISFRAEIRDEIARTTDSMKNQVSFAPKYVMHDKYFDVELAEHIENFADVKETRISFSAWADKYNTLLYRAEKWANRWLVDEYPRALREIDGKIRQYNELLTSTRALLAKDIAVTAL